MTTYTTQSEAVANRPEGDYQLARFDVDGVVSFEWLTDVDVDELGVYGYDDDFELVSEGEESDEAQFACWFVDSSDRPAFVDTSEWDDRDNG